MVDVTPSDRDPTIDELMMILKGEVRIGAGMTGVMDEAYNHLENYRQFMERRLRQGLWRQEGKAVRSAALSPEDNGAVSGLSAALP